MFRQASGVLVQRLFAAQGCASNQAARGGSRLLWNAAQSEPQAISEGAAAAQASASSSLKAPVPQFSSAVAAALASKRAGLTGLGGFKLGEARPFGSFARPAAPGAATPEAGTAGIAAVAAASNARGLLRRLAAVAMAAAAGLLVTASPAAADAPEPWQMNFQDAATSQMQAAVDLHHDIMFILITVVVLVGYMMLQIFTKFHYSKVVTPELLTHHTTLEVIWTIVPTMLVLLIAVPSLTLIYAMDQHTERPGLTVKVIGRQWYWSYEVHDHLQQKLLDPDRLVSIAEKALLKA